MSRDETEAQTRGLPFPAGLTKSDRDAENCFIGFNDGGDDRRIASGGG